MTIDPVSKRRRLCAIVLCGIAFIAGCRETSRSAPGAGDESQAAPPEWFTDVTDEMGLAFRHDEEPPGTFEMPEIMGSGGAFVDYDGDGLLDVFLANGVLNSAGRAAHEKPLVSTNRRRHPFGCDCRVGL